MQICYAYKNIAHYPTKSLMLTCLSSLQCGVSEYGYEQEEDGGDGERKEESEGQERLACIINLCSTPQTHLLN